MTRDGQEPTYSQEEVNEILRRALDQQSRRGRVLSHDELVELAGEVGIDPTTLEQATAELAEARAAEVAEQARASELAAERARGLARLTSSLVTFSIIGVLLYLLERRLGQGPWFYWPLAGFAIVLAFRLRAVLFPHEALERRRRRDEREERRAHRRAEREAFRRRVQSVLGAPTPGSREARAAPAVSREFEAAVHAGVAALLAAVARRLQPQVERSIAAEPSPRGRRANETRAAPPRK